MKVKTMHNGYGFTKHKYYSENGEYAGTCYTFSYNSMLSGHDVTLYYDDNGKWSGDTIAYGEWRDLDDIEIKDYKHMIGE